MVAIPAVAVPAISTVTNSIMAEYLGRCWARAREDAHGNSENFQASTKKYL